MLVDVHNELPNQSPIIYQEHSHCREPISSVGVQLEGSKQGDHNRDDDDTMQAVHCESGQPVGRWTDTTDVLKVFHLDNKIIIRDAERRKKEASNVIQTTRQSNTVHPRH